MILFFVINFNSYLRDMLYKNDEITAYFNEETLHILDYDCEYDKGFPDPEKFPEFNNRVFRFFNNDTSMTTGFFKIGDVETGAVMNLKVFNIYPIYFLILIPKKKKIKNM